MVLPSYSRLIVLRPAKNWNVEILSFELDGKLEFIEQWYDEDIDPIIAVLGKLQRVCGLQGSVVSTVPVYKYENEKKINYYCCIIPYNRFRTKIQYYEKSNWTLPRHIYRLLNKTDREGMLGALAWLEKFNFQAMFLTRHSLLFS